MSVPFGASTRSRLDWIAPGVGWAWCSTSDIGAGAVSVFFFNADSRGIACAVYAFGYLHGNTNLQCQLFSQFGSAGTQALPPPGAVHTALGAVSPWKLDEAAGGSTIQLFALNNAPAPANFLWTENPGQGNWIKSYADAPLAIIPAGYSLGAQVAGGGTLQVGALIGPWP